MIARSHGAQSSGAPPRRRGAGSIIAGRGARRRLCGDLGACARQVADGAAELISCPRVRLATLLIFAVPVFGFGCAPRSPEPSIATTGPIAATPPARDAIAAPALSSPRQRVCADVTCGGPGAVVQQWHDGQGTLVRWEIVDSPRCPHLAGLFYDREGHNPVLLPLPFLPPGSPNEQRAVRSMHDAEIRGLTAGARTVCDP
jgi:hypothetical protein